MSSILELIEDMRIAIDCRFIGKSGIGTYIENVVGELLKCHSQHQYLLVVNPETIIGVDCSANVEILKTEIKPFSIKELVSFPVSEINQCDAFFTPYINTPGGIKVPVYSTIHDCVFFDVDGIISPIGKWIRKWFYSRAIRLSEKIFTVSCFSKERILYHFHTDKEIVVTGNGISKYIHDYRRESPTEKQDYIIYVGNIKRHKGLHTLIDAYLKAKRRGLKARLLIVGNSLNFRTADNDLSIAIEKTEGIEFTGWVSGERLVALICEAKALVQPSLYEGFGIPPLEALYLGTNVILSDITVFKEIYSGLPVVYFKYDDAGDLADKLISHACYDLPVDIQDKINKMYSYKKVAETIIEQITLKR